MEAEASRLEHGRAPDRLSLGSPKAVLTLTGRDTPAGGDDLPLDASLTVTNAAGGGLRDIRLAVSGPLVMNFVKLPNRPPSVPRTVGNGYASQS